MEKKKVLSRIEQGSFALFILIGTINKLWYKEEYLSTISWAFLCIYFIATVNNREGKSPWVLTIDLIFGICTIIILINDISAYLR